jgi:Holliday junction resolvase-like predicted endonuclease
MLMNAKRKGSRQERKARKALEAAGYLVIKAGGSLGLFDLVAENRQGVRHIQVKSNRLPDPAERENMLSVKGRLPQNSTIEIWVFYDGQTEPRIEVL